jgi:hypothetical protein
MPLEVFEAVCFVETEQYNGKPFKPDVDILLVSALYSVSP